MAPDGKVVSESVARDNLSNTSNSCQCSSVPSTECVSGVKASASAGRSDVGWWGEEKAKNLWEKKEGGGG